MANLRLAMDAAFWDLNVSTPQTLDGTARAVPGEPAPLDGARASRSIRPQQISFFRNAFPLGITPSFSPTCQKELGSFALQSFLLGASFSDWWIGLVGQFRPRKLISAIKAEVTSGDELELPAFKDVAKHFLDKSLYALGFCSQVSLTPDTSLLFSTEGHGERKGFRTKATLIHKLPDHDITIEAAWPELFRDKNGIYWDVPTSLSLDMASLIFKSGLRYRFGLHKNSGYPQPLNPSIDDNDVPLSLMPGLCAKAAFSYEKTRDFWREKEKKDANQLETEPAWLASYDERLNEPHSSISGFIGGSCAAWFGGEREVGANVGSSIRKRNPFGADLFGSVCYTFQRGKFKNDFNDLTRMDARLDFSSVSAFIKGTTQLISDVFGSPVRREVNPLASPRLSLIFQQQVAGPIVFRVDSRFTFNSPSGKHIPHVEDFMCSLSYSLRMLRSGKILAWYSPKRKEAMIELRLFEF